MNVKDLIKQIPYTVAIYRKVARLIRGRSNKDILTQLENNSHRQGRQIWEAVMSLNRGLSRSDQHWIDRIEFEREYLLKRDELLNDGSLGEAGLYDDSVSIKDACLVSKPPKPAFLLFLLTRVMRPKNVIELGTNVGISSAYMGVGLKASGQNGRIISLDASPYRQRVAREVHQNLGVDNISYVEGLFTHTLHPALAKLGSIDLAFIDGHHQYQSTLDYFEEILKFSTPNTVFVFDDIRWSDGMKKAWARIKSDDRLDLIVDLSSIGVCTRRQQESSQRFVSAPIYVL
ncbi:MAG: class I SAM-dependent methyltransferase [Cyanobacteria bacterium J06633_2]